MSKPNMLNFLTTDFYGLTAEEYSLGRNNVQVVKELIKSGIKVIQYREKEKPARQMFQECLAIRDLTLQSDVTFIINDHIDLAMMIGADGVHVGQDDLPVEKIREIIGQDMIIGLSTHSENQAQEAVKCGVVDYIGVGPIFATQTKKDVCCPVGLDYLSYVVNNIDIPFVAIGGIKLDNIKKVRQGGAKIMALVTEIVGSEDIVGKVADLRQTINKIQEESK